MKLYYWKGSNGKQNFGDELNTVIWPQLIPEVLNSPADEFLCGIGTLLNHRLPQSRPMTILGSGVGYGDNPVLTSHTSILSVRGPLSARALGIDEKYAIIDPGVLVKKIITKPPPPKAFQYAYMPHWMNASDVFEDVFAEMGWKYINPLWEVEKVLYELQRCECLVAEAMHGAIIADALRIPWIPVVDDSNSHSLAFKWEDWCASIQIAYTPSNIPDLFTYLLQMLHGLADLKELQEIFGKIVQTQKPVLSHDRLLQTKTTQLEEKIGQLADSYRS